MACESCAQLTRELREAREEIEELSRPQKSFSAEVQKTRDWLGTPCRLQTAKLLLCLMKTPGRILDNDTLLFAMDYHGDGDASHIISVHTAMLRSSLRAKGLGPCVLSAYGRGRFIEKEDADLIREDMNEA